MPATTLAGLGIKALALASLYIAEGFPDPKDEEWHETTDRRSIVQIVRDLLAVERKEHGEVRTPMEADARV